MPGGKRKHNKKRKNTSYDHNVKPISQVARPDENPRHHARFADRGTRPCLSGDGWRPGPIQRGRGGDRYQGGISIPIRTRKHDGKGRGDLYWALHTYWGFYCRCEIWDRAGSFYAYLSQWGHAFPRHGGTCRSNESY